jgi:tRNA-guanine family transglycosylase
VAKELSAIRLATIHNLYFVESLMRQIRAAIVEGSLAVLMREWLCPT